MAIREAFLQSIETGEVVNKIIIDDEKAYAPEAGLVVVFPRDTTEYKTLDNDFSVKGE